MADETTKQAVALRYDGERAPHVSSKGEGDFAEQILAMARESGLYIHQDPALLERLGALKEGESVPRTLCGHRRDPGLLLPVAGQVSRTLAKIRWNPGC